MGTSGSVGYCFRAVSRLLLCADWVMFAGVCGCVFARVKGNGPLGLESPAVVVSSVPFFAFILGKTSVDTCAGSRRKVERERQGRAGRRKADGASEPKSLQRAARRKASKRTQRPPSLVFFDCDDIPLNRSRRGGQGALFFLCMCPVFCSVVGMTGLPHCPSTSTSTHTHTHTHTKMAWFVPVLSARFVSFAVTSLTAPLVLPACASMSLV